MSQVRDTIISYRDAQGRTVYYQGWQQTLGEALDTRDIREAKRMTRATANRHRRRLENPVTWGVRCELHTITTNP